MSFKKVQGAGSFSGKLSRGSSVDPETDFVSSNSSVSERDFVIGIQARKGFCGVPNQIKLFPVSPS